MTFYFIAHVLLGVLTGNTAFVVHGIPPAFKPLWASKPIALYIATFACLACAAAVITTFVKYSFGWAIVTIGELILGLGLSNLIPRGSPTFLVAFLLNP